MLVLVTLWGARLGRESMSIRGCWVPHSVGRSGGSTGPWTNWVSVFGFGCLHGGGLAPDSVLLRVQEGGDFLIPDKHLVGGIVEYYTLLVVEFHFLQT